MSIVSAMELQDILRQVQSDETIPLMELADAWLHWFKKRGDRYMKDAAKLGYSEIILDLPIELATSKDRKALVLIQSSIQVLVEGCFVGFILDEYNEKEICKLLISWKN